MSEQLFKIEQNVDTNNMHFSYQTDSFDDFHAMFFEKLKEIKDPNDTAELDELINNFELKSGEISTKDSLSEQEQMIIESFFNSIHPYEEIDFNVEVCEFYISELNQLGIPQKNLELCLNAISFYKNLLLYVDSSEGISEKSTSYNFRPCSGRSCFDCCMYRRSQDLARTDLVEKAIFVLTIRASVGMWVGSCAYSCLS